MMLRLGILRFVRRLRHEPAIVASVVAICGLSAGVAGLAADLVVRAYVRPSQAVETGRVVRIESLDARQGAPSDNTAPDVAAARASVTTARHVAGYFTTDYNLTPHTSAVPIRVTFASADIWPLAHVAPLHGTTYSVEHDRPGGDVRKVVLAHGLWMTAWGGDPAIVGRTVRLGLAQFEVLGVMPEGFAFPDRADAWAPLEAWFAYLGTTSTSIARGGRAYAAVARLPDGADPSQLQDELDRLSADLAREFPATNEHLRFVATPFAERASADSRPFIVAALGATLWLWATALAAMAAIGAVRRTRDQTAAAIHRALGASRRHVVVFAAGEAALPSLASAVLATVVAQLLAAWLVRLIPGVHPLWLEADVTGAGLAVAVLLAAISASLPALSSARYGESRSAPLWTRSGDAPANPWTARVAAGQVALAASLGVVGCSFAYNLAALGRVAPGFVAGDGVAVYVSPPGDDIAPTERLTQYAALYDRVLHHVRQEPGILSAGAVNVLPLVARTGFQRSAITASGQTPEAQARNPIAGVLRASTGYLEAMGVPLIAGRDFSEHDRRETQRVAIVSQALAERLWPTAPALGQRIKLGAATSSSPWATVIGVAGDVRTASLGQTPGADVYFSYRQVIAGEAYVVVRSRFGETHAMAAAERAVHQASPHSAVFRRTTLRRLVADSLWQERLSAAVVGMLGVMAMAVAAVTIYGTISALLASARRELAIRTALGADAAAILRRIAVTAARIAVPAAIGCVLLTAAAAASLDRAVSQPAPLAASALAGVCFAVVVVVAAAAGPARAAIRGDAASSLRGE